MGWRTNGKTILQKCFEKKLVGFHISPVHSRFNIGVSSLPIAWASYDAFSKCFERKVAEIQHLSTNRCRNTPQ